MATARVLIVDDDPPALKAMCRLLSVGGRYDVLPATGSRQALAIVKSGSPVDVVIADVEMPELHGPELLEQIAEMSPATAGVLVSGGVDEAKLPAAVPLLRKPFSANELLSTVERVLAESKRLTADIARTMQRAVDLHEQARHRSRELCEAIREVGESRRGTPEKPR